MASAGFEPANFGTKCQHATLRPPKPLFLCVISVISNKDGIGSYNAAKNLKPRDRYVYFSYGCEWVYEDYFLLYCNAFWLGTRRPMPCNNLMSLYSRIHPVDSS